MEDLKALLEIVSMEEQTLQFEKFSIDMAHEIGIMLLNKAKEERKPVAIDISRNGHQLFHAALEGSSPDNDAWIQRKMAVVNRFSHSSFYMQLSLAMEDKSIEDAYLLDEWEFAAHGGSFPITIKETGVVGTITVSGLPSEEDHRLVVDVLTAYLKGEDK